MKAWSCDELETPMKLKNGHAAPGVRAVSFFNCAGPVQAALRVVAGVALFTLLTCCSAAAKHYYVAPTGSDDNPGTQAAPLLTISRADALASAGYTIHVAPGTYQVSAPSPNTAGIQTSKSGTAHARIKFVSDVKWGAKIVFSGTGIAWKSEGAYVDIEGFDISGTGRIGILAKGGNETITKNFVHDLAVSGGCNGRGGAGIDVWVPGAAVVDSNVVRNIGVQWTAGRSCNTVHGIYVASQNNKISNNVISGAASVGINSWHGATASRIVNNTIFNSKMGIVIGHGDSGATALGSRNNYVANNIVYGNGYGISEMGKVGGNNRYVDNLVYSNGSDWRVEGKVSGTISADPLFINYQANGAGDYRLQRGSPARGRGATTDLPPAALPEAADEKPPEMGSHEDQTPTPHGPEPRSDITTP